MKELRFTALIYIAALLCCYTTTASNAPTRNTPNTHKILYKTSDGSIIEPRNVESFGGSIVSNSYVNGQGVIIFDAPITTIGSEAFKDCSKMTSVTIPYGVTSIEDYAFAGTGLTKVAIPASVELIGCGVFAYCDNLSSFSGKFASKDCRTLNYYNTIVAFAPKGLNSYVIPSGITSVGESAFEGCGNLTNITLPKSVTLVEASAFYGCSKLQSFQGRFATADGRAIVIDGTMEAFAPAGLTSFTIPAGVTKLKESLFKGCTSLSNIVLSDEVASIGKSCFYGCSSLTSISIPTGIASIEDKTFFNCRALSSINISSNIIFIGNSAFEGCINLGKVEISDLTAWCRILFKNNQSNPLHNGAKLYIKGQEACNITIPSDVKEIGFATFCGCSSLKEVTIANGVAKIGKFAFKDCRNITKIEIPYSITSIGVYAFARCRGEIVINSQIIEKDYQSYSCPASNWLKESLFSKITIGDSIQKIGNYALYNCADATTFVISNSVYAIGQYAFGGCSGELVIDSKVVENDYSTMHAPSCYNGWLYGSKFSKITIGNKVKKIGQNLFYDSNYNNITIGDSVETIEEGAFKSCDKLTSITIPDCVTTVKTSAFAECSSLTEITIGKGVTTIEVDAFYECRNLTSIYCRATIPPVGYTLMFGIAEMPRTIYVPATSFKAYRKSAFWNPYKQQITPYEVQ